MAVNDKPAHATGYDPRRTELSRRACLEVATRLNDFKDDLCVVGGLVPSLLADMTNLPAGVEPHVGTNDLDLGLSVAILDERRYEEIAKRLREAGFKRDTNDSGRPTSQRWDFGQGALVDFLIPPSTDLDKGGNLRNLEGDLAAVITPGLHLAFRDREEITLDGDTLTGGTARRVINVCGPGAFVVLKSLAFKSRAENKDAYDLWYVIQTRTDCASRFRALRGDVKAEEALQILQQDFTDAGRIGPRRVAEFLFGGSDENLQADVAGLVRGLIAEVLRPS
ncbi:MAG TPA: GSU2403 family nucleotidyltransferase fold protein [Gemmataceae bacterium]|jgi:hypothetical protein